MCRSEPSKYRHLGQHFLIDKNHRSKFLTAMQMRNSSVIWDIGAGSGLLAQDLLSMGHNLYLFEYDFRWCKHLRERFAHEIDQGRCTIVSGDACKTWQNTPIPDYIVSNFPFDIGIPFLMDFTMRSQKLIPIQGILQKELVERISARPSTKSYGHISVFLQMYYEVKVGYTIPPGAFSPPPNVMCSTITLSPKKSTVPLDLRINAAELLKIGFRMRRKTLQNNFKGIVGDEQQGLLTTLGNRRAESLTLDEWERLCEKVQNIAP